MEKVAAIRRLDDDDKERDLAYWLSRTPDERVAEVERLRREFYGPQLDKPMARVARVISLGSCEAHFHPSTIVLDMIQSSL